MWCPAEFSGIQTCHLKKVLKAIFAEDGHLQGGKQCPDLKGKNEWVDTDNFAE